MKLSAQKIQSFLQDKYPEHEEMLNQLPVVAKLEPSSSCIPEAVLRVVIGQMLSRAAARAIYGRVCSAAIEDCVEPWLLPREDLRECGLSNSKCKTIVQFVRSYQANPKSYESWRNMEFPKLEEAVMFHWGMSRWTAGILAIFHFGHEDVFPESDGSLRRALATLTSGKRGLNKGNNFLEPSLASPYRSYLALYLWKALDLSVI